MHGAANGRGKQQTSGKKSSAIGAIETVTKATGRLDSPAVGGDSQQSQPLARSGSDSYPFAELSCVHNNKFFRDLASCSAKILKNRFLFLS